MPWHPGVILVSSLSCRCHQICVILMSSCVARHIPLYIAYISQTRSKLAANRFQIHAQYLPNSCPISPNFVPNISQMHAQVIPISCQIHAKFVPSSCRIHPKIIPNSSQHQPNLCYNYGCISVRDPAPPPAPPHFLSS